MEIKSVPFQHEIIKRKRDCQRSKKRDQRPKIKDRKPCGTCMMPVVMPPMRSGMRHSRMLKRSKIKDHKSETEAETFLELDALILAGPSKYTRNAERVGNENSREGICTEEKWIHFPRCSECASRSLKSRSNSSFDDRGCISGIKSTLFQSLNPQLSTHFRRYYTLPRYSTQWKSHLYLQGSRQPLLAIN